MSPKDTCFQTLYDSHFSKLYKYFYYKYFGHAGVEDSVHDVFMVIYEKYLYLEDQTELIKILYGVARNKYREEVRKRLQDKTLQATLKERLQLGLELDEDLEDDSHSTHDQLKEKVKQCITELREPTKTVIEKRFLEGWSRKQVAEHLNTTEDSVHTYQKRGISYLKKLVSQEL
jgi:RNA polymerase sigma factor (sigma-70 family)